MTRSTGTRQNWDQELKAFLEAGSESAPDSIRTGLLAQVTQDLSPAHSQVFAKLMAVHALTSLVTLSVCPQFGFRLLGQGSGLEAIFMQFGHLGCMVACGVFFLGTSLLIASLLLRPEEIRTIRRTRWLGLGALALLSLGFFVMVSPSVIASMGLAWLAGAWLGGMGALELGWRLRLRYQLSAAASRN